jgi:hypothetical protein
MRDEFARGAMSRQDLAREILDFRNVELVKVTILIMLEQRYVIRFLLKDGLAIKEIPKGLSRLYEPDAMKETQVRYWVREIRTGGEAPPMRRRLVGHVKSILTLF